MQNMPLKEKNKNPVFKRWVRERKIDSNGYYDGSR